MDRILTPEEIAERLTITPGTVKRYLRDGIITGAIKVGDLWRLSEKDLERWLKLKRKNAPARAKTHKKNYRE